MEVLVKVNLKSVKKNPQRGKFSTRIPTYKIIYLKGKSIPTYLKDKENYELVEKILEISSEKGECVETFTGILYNEDLIEQLLKDGVFIEIKQNSHTIYHSPAPEYLYSYENVVLKCNCCKKEFNSNDNYEECPYCETVYDCTFEKIEDALKRKKNDKKS